MENKPICYVPERVIPEIMSGVPSFLGLPVIENDEDLKKADFVFGGVPWEGVNTYGGFTGCEVSPKRIREASTRYGAYLPEFDIDAFDHFKGGDIGDMMVQNGNEEFSFQAMRDGINRILKHDKMPILFGGDHSISYPLISEFAKKYNGNIGIIQFDAHLDNMETYGGEQYARCSPFYNLYNDENIDASKLVHFGIHGPRNHPDGLKTAKKAGASVITGLEIKQKGLQESIQKAIDIASDGTEAVYVSVCSDVLDVAFNPAGPPDMMGLTTFELGMALHEVGKQANVRGMDFVELYPGQDPNNVSGHVATWMTIYLLSGLAVKKVEKES